MIARLELEVGFSAAHRVDSPRASCAGLLHGHNFRVRVAFEGQIDPVSGTVVDAPRAEALLRELVFAPFDHGVLNDLIENPTLERVAAHIFGALATVLPVAELSLEDGAGRRAVVKPSAP
ncbi:MAG: 6-carboxytetrahydropterin synthase [Deltaproteobacteria bacterium]|nr:6-carboxytetrahydropterin synthase [Deltaproteobacteria bacterium]